MKKIVIIGVGQLGSRYLQGLAKTKHSISIQLVEPSKQSQEIAHARYNEMPVNKNIHSLTFHQSINELHDELDVVIIATNADVRFKLANQLLQTKKVNFLVFEKVLFQRYQEYNEMKMILEKKGIKAWVNHPRRLFPFYEKYRASFQRASRINYHVQGGLWGLCCNSLHYIDHMMQLQNNPAPKVDIDTNNLDAELLDSKRGGYLEICGTLNGRVGRCDFALTCNDSIASPPIINILSDTVKMTVDELSGWARIATKDTGWKWEEYSEKIVCYQSELTGNIVDEIIDTGKSLLPSYDEAMHLHQPFIKEIQSKLNEVTDEDLALCPIS